MFMLDVFFDFTLNIFDEYRGERVKYRDNDAYFMNIESGWFIGNMAFGTCLGPQFTLNIWYYGQDENQISRCLIE